MRVEAHGIAICHAELPQLRVNCAIIDENIEFIKRGDHHERHANLLQVYSFKNDLTECEFYFHAFFQMRNMIQRPCKHSAFS